MCEDKEKLKIETYQDNDSLYQSLKSQVLSVSDKTPYLLAHADDGVIWGRFDNGALTTASQVFTRPEFDFPELRLETLQQCRIFGEKGQVLLWKYGEKWKSRFIGNPEEDKILPPENQILWGTHGRKQDNFTLLWDGLQGLKHAVPLTEISLDNNNKLIKPVRLVVHHHITYDNDGLARIYRSRLVDLTINVEDN